MSSDVKEYVEACLDCKQNKSCLEDHTPLMPIKILTDNGGSFDNELLAELNQIMKTKHLFTTAYHPQTNGICERYIRPLSGMLKAFVDKAGKDWDRYLAPVLFAYRTALNESTGMEPYFLLFGKQARYPIDVILNPEVEVTEEDLGEFCTDIVNKLKIAKLEAVTNIENAQQKHPTKNFLS